MIIENANEMLQTYCDPIPSQRRKRGDCMPTSKKQLEKLNKAKKAKAEELSKQAASGNESAKKKLKKLMKKIK
jgi:hypothetical protein